MKFKKTIKVELNKEEKDAIKVVLSMLENMWDESEDYEREELWKQYGGSEDGWACIEDTLKNLLYRG